MKKVDEFISKYHLVLDRIYEALTFWCIRLNLFIRSEVLTNKEYKKRLHVRAFWYWKVHS